MSCPSIYSLHYASLHCLSPAPPLSSLPTDYDNYLYQAKDGNYGGGQDCSPGGTTVGGNTVWTPTGSVTECGKSLAAYQATGGDPGTTAAAYPADSVVLGIAKQLMGL